MEHFNINIIFIEKGVKQQVFNSIQNMKTETQNLIVSILGFYALLSLIGIIVLSSFTTHDNEIILALVPVTTTPISILGGFVAGKTLTEKQEEDLAKQNDELLCGDEAISSDVGSA